MTLGVNEGIPPIWNQQIRTDLNYTMRYESFPVINQGPYILLNTIHNLQQINIFQANFSLFPFNGWELNSIPNDYGTQFINYNEYLNSKK